MEFNGVAHEGRVVEEVEAGPVLRYATLLQQLLPQLHAHVWLKHFGVPQAVDHDDDVVVELEEGLAADVKCLLWKKEGIKSQGEWQSRAE